MLRKTISADNGLHFITPTVIDWIDIFTRPVYRHMFLESIQYCQQHKGLQVHAWCLMSNHAHLVVSAGNGNHLSHILRDLKKYTSKAIVAAIDHPEESRKGWMLNRFAYAGKFDSRVKNYKFWQDGNAPEPIYTAQFLEQKIDYIHQNPVRAELVEEPEQYVYSSAVDYAGGKGLIDIVFV
jgi:putative transposase